MAGMLFLHFYPIAYFKRRRMYTFFFPFASCLPQWRVSVVCAIIRRLRLFDFCCNSCCCVSSRVRFWFVCFSFFTCMGARVSVYSPPSLRALPCSGGDTATTYSRARYTSTLFLRMMHALIQTPVGRQLLRAAASAVTFGGNAVRLTRGADTVRFGPDVFGFSCAFVVVIFMVGFECSFLPVASSFGGRGGVKGL